MQLLYNVLCNLLPPGVIPGINSEEATHSLFQGNEGNDELADDLLPSIHTFTVVVLKSEHLVSLRHLDNQDTCP